MKKKRNSKFQYGVRSKSNNKVASEISTSINNKVANEISTSINKKEFIIVLFVIYSIELYIISIFNDNTKKAIVDFQLVLLILSLVLTPICLWQIIMNSDSKKKKKKKLELNVFILDSILLVILGYLIVFSEMAEKTGMVRTILTNSNNFLNLIVLLLTPIKIYYSIQLFWYSRKEDTIK